MEIIQKFKQKINGISQKKYTMDELKDKCPPINRNWFPVTDKMLEDIKSYYTRGERKILCKNIKNILVSQFGEFKLEYTDGTSEDLVVENWNLKTLKLKPEIQKLNFELTTYDIAANAFFGDKLSCDNGVSLHVHHIDNCAFHNTPDNLIYLKFCEHADIHTFMWKDACDICKNCEEYAKKYKNNKR